MSVLVQKGKPPEGSVTISKEEAASMQWKLIYEWKPTNDVWPFRYGTASLAIGAGISAIMVVAHFRRKLKLRSVGHFAMYMPNVIIPTLALPILHQKLISEPILLQSECPVCIQLRSIVVQNALALGYPLLLVPTSGFMLATSFATYRMPLFSFGNLGTFFNLFRDMLRPFSTRLLGLSLFQTMLAIAVTESEARSFMKIQRTILERHNFETEPNSTSVQPIK